MGMIREGGRWKLGDGAKIKFWKDKWMKEQALEEIQEVREVAEEIQRKYGFWVKDYIIEGRWKVLELEGQEEKINIINQWLQQTYIPRLPKPDKKIWGGTNSGEYTVKTGYELVRGKGQEEEIYKKIWKNRATPKVTAFLWLSAKGKILTMDNLKKRGWQLPNRCPLCKREEETVDHLLVNCRFAWEIWGAAASQLRVSWVQPRSWKEVVVTWRTPYASQRLSKLWEITLAQVAWNIWKERNRRIFQDKEREARAVWALTKEAIKENMSIIPNKGMKELGNEEQIRKAWDLPRMDGGKEDPRKNARWSPPPLGWMKMNFDGAAKGNPGEAGGGGIIRNHKGEVVWAFSEYYGTQTNHKAEMLAMKTGIQGCEKMGTRKIIIEGDSLNMVRLLKGETAPDWRNENLIEDLKEIIKGWDEVKIQHNFREGNKVADLLANRGVRNRYEEQWDKEGPNDIQDQVKADLKI